MTPVTAAMLKALPSFVFVCTPYTKFAGGVVKAAKQAAIATAYLIKDGISAVSPIAHSHAVSTAGMLDHLDWDLWRRVNEPLIDSASAAVVVKMKGWEQSVGITYEIKRFTDAGKNIIYVEPGEVGL